MSREGKTHQKKKRDKRIESGKSPWPMGAIKTKMLPANAVVWKKLKKTKLKGAKKLAEDILVVNVLIYGDIIIIICGMREKKTCPVNIKF